jgi:hypothetical protein
MTIDAITVTAIATSVYGAATLLLVIQIWRDRVQRERHFRDESDNHKLNELRNAFYEGWGYWEGFTHASSESKGDAAQSGRMYEALIRLECQLRLNAFESQANNLGLVVRTDIHKVNVPLADAGIALGLLPSQYRRG